MVLNFVTEFVDTVVQLVQLFVIPFFTWLFYYLKDGKEVAAEYNKRIFASFISKFTAEYNEKARDHKLALFRDLKDKKDARILEVGIGSGANLEFYPSYCRLTAVEPNEYFEEHLRKNLEKYPGIKLDNFFLCLGENMKEVPSESFDVVVTSLVNCSVSNIPQLLKEIRRVLVPGGKYYFIEHCLESNKSSLRFWIQQFVTTTRIWPLTFEGCEFKNLEQELVNSGGFSHVTSSNFHIPQSGLWVFKLISPHISGIARK